MDKYIKAEDLIDRIYPVDPDNDGSDGGTVVYQNLTLSSPEIEAIVEEMPAADVAPVVHGRWVPFKSEHAGNIWYCSECSIGFAAQTDFCPHCGAKMYGGKTNEN